MSYECGQLQQAFGTAQIPLNIIAYEFALSKDDIENKQAYKQRERK